MEEVGVTRFQSRVSKQIIMVRAAELQTDLCRRHDRQAFCSGRSAAQMDDDDDNDDDDDDDGGSQG